jgi:hypothetical protein
MNNSSQFIGFRKKPLSGDPTSVRFETAWSAVDKTQLLEAFAKNGFIHSCLAQRRQGAKKTLHDRGSALRLCAFAGDLLFFLMSLELVREYFLCNASP